MTVGSDSIYLGGVELVAGTTRKDCQFPAFFIEEARRITHTIEDLRCRESGGETANPLLTLRIAQPPPMFIPTKGDPNKQKAVLAEWAKHLPVNLADRKSRAPLGLPDAPAILDRIYYTLGYDPALRAPRWVAFTVDAPKELNLNRLPDVWLRDPDIPADLQTDPADYRGNPYDRGHLIARRNTHLGDPARARAAEREIYYYSAVVPQAQETNRTTWLAIENFTTAASANAGPIHVVAGPIYPDSARTRVPFLVIGPGRTRVPTALFRVLLRKTRSGAWRSLAFIVPNDGSSERDAKKFQRSVKEVEAATGLKFFPDRAPEQSTDTAAFLAN